MSIRASCGHELTTSEGMGIQITLAEIDRDGSPCTKTGCCCNQCAKERQHWQSYVSSKEEEKAWFEQRILPGDFRKKKKAIVTIKSHGSLVGEVNTTVSLAEMQRNCPGFFRRPFGKRETYTSYKGCVIVRNTVTFDRCRAIRRTAVYLYLPKGFVDSPSPNFCCVGAGNSNSIRTAKKYIDLILNRGEYAYGEWDRI